MYVCFFDEKDDRSWEKYDVKFLNDTKRVIQSILTKKITTNSLAGSYASLEAILENSGCGIYVADMSKSEILYMNNYCKQLLSNIIEQNKLEKYIFSHTAESRSFTEVYVTEEDKWFREMRSELKKVVWPDGKTTAKNTGTVILCSLGVGVFIWVFDAVAVLAVNTLVGLFAA